MRWISADKATEHSGDRRARFFSRLRRSFKAVAEVVIHGCVCDVERWWVASLYNELLEVIIANGAKTINVLIELLRTKYELFASFGRID